jgi:hypothetical protein
MAAYILSLADYISQYLVVLTSALAGVCWLRSAVSHTLEQQSHWNAWAAGWATISAFGQAAIFLKTTPFPILHG